MKKLFKNLLFTLLVLAVSCGGAATTSRVLKKNNTDATIQGVGVTEKDAMISAENIAKETFGEFVIYNVEKCKTVQEEGKTQYICVIQVNKK